MKLCFAKEDEWDLILYFCKCLQFSSWSGLNVQCSHKLPGVNRWSSAAVLCGEGVEPLGGGGLARQSEPLESRASQVTAQHMLSFLIHRYKEILPQTPCSPESPPSRTGFPAVGKQGTDYRKRGWRRDIIALHLDLGNVGWGGGDTQHTTHGQTHLAAASTM